MFLSGVYQFDKPYKEVLSILGENTALSLQDKNFIRINEDEILFTVKVFEIFKDKKVVQSRINKRAVLVAPLLIKIYPTGKKNGSYPWVDPEKVIIKKLEGFMKKYPEYSNKEIIEATRKYVNSFTTYTRETGMMVLKYFIEKNYSSTLAAFIESGGEDNKNQIRTNKI